jgi:uncharacterized lipoprotein YmbA
MRLLALVAVVSLAACASKPEMAWYKTGSTEEMFYQEQGQCQAQAFGVPGVSTFQAALVYNSCMKGKGWYQAPARRS